MKTTQRTFNTISVVALVLALLLGGFYLSENTWGDDDSLTEQLKVLGYCPPGETWTGTPQDGASNGTNGSADDGEVCTPLNAATGDLIPSADDVYTLGTPVFRWKSLQLGPGTIFI